jgi:hypothetical protein
LRASSIARGGKPDSAANNTGWRGVASNHGRAMAALGFSGPPGVAIFWRQENKFCNAREL